MGKKRKPVPYYKKSHKCWYFDKNGKPVRLDPDEQTAWDLYHKYMAGAIDVDPGSHVVLLLGQFLDWSERNHAPDTYKFYKVYIDHFTRWLTDNGLKELRLSEVKPFHIMRWVDDSWPLNDITDRSGKVTVRRASANTRHGAMRAVQRAFSWARKAGLIKENPVQYVEKPKPTRRLKGEYLWPHEYAELITHIKDEFIDVVETLRHTGCRPQELRFMEARYLDREHCCWSFPDKPWVPKKLRGRVVHLSEVAYAISCKWADRNPEGKMFLNTDGAPWQKKALVDRCKRLRAKVKFYVTPYTIRHTFATDALLRGLSTIEVRHLMGHASTRMLDEIYQHIEKHGNHLKEALKKATAHLQPVTAKTESVGEPAAKPNGQQETFVLCRVDENGNYVPVANEQATETIKAL